MKCPNCNVDSISYWQIFLSSRIFKARCKECGARFYCGGLIELIANFVTYFGALVLIGMAFLFQSILYWLALIMLFVFYEVVKTKFSKWIVVNRKQNTKQTYGENNSK